MSLATTLLEGYVGGKKGSDKTISDPSSHIQESCISFIQETVDAYQLYKTADIIGSISVLKESSNAQAVYESVVTDYMKKLTNTVKSFVSKFSSWLKSIKALVKNKIQSAKDSSLHKKVMGALDGRDNDEQISDFEYPAIEYTISNGLKTTELYVDEMNELYYNISEALFSVMSGKVSIDKQQSVIKQFSLEKVKTELKKRLKCDPDNILSNVESSFKKASQNKTTYTVGCIRDIVSDIKEQESAVNTQLKEADALEEILNGLYRKFEAIETEDGDTINPDIVGTLSVSITYILNLEVSTLKTSINQITESLDQSRDLLTSILSVIKGGNFVQQSVHEGSTVEDDDTDDIDVVEESFLGNIKESIRNSKDLRRLMKEVGLREEGKKFTEALKFFRKKDYQNAIDGFNDYIKAIKEIKKKINSVKKDYPSNVIASANNSCDLEIAITKNFIETAKIKKSAVKEGVDFNLGEDYSTLLESVSIRDEFVAVTEAKNVNMIKKYIESSRSLVGKAMRQANKLYKTEKYNEAKKSYIGVREQLTKQISEFSDIPDDVWSDVKSIAAGTIMGFIIGLQEFIDNPLVNKTMVSYNSSAKAAQDTNDSRNLTKNVIVSKLEACVSYCNRQIKACDSKGATVSESVSIFEQAANYLI